MISLSSIAMAIVYLIVAGLVFWLLRDVPPSLAAKDFIDRGNAYAEFIRNLLLGCIAFRVAIPNQPNRLGG